MRDHLILDASAGYRGSGSPGRTLTRALLVPSQDVCRYQAKNMPRPTYDLDRKESHAYLIAIFAATLALVAFGAAIILVARIGTWLGR